MTINEFKNKRKQAELLQHYAKGELCFLNSSSS